MKRLLVHGCSFELPEGLTLPNLAGLTADAGVSAPLSGSSLARAFDNHIDASLTWSFVAWLRSVTRLPLFVKARPLGAAFAALWGHQLTHLAQTCMLLATPAQCSHHGMESMQA